MTKQATFQKVHGKLVLQIFLYTGPQGIPTDRKVSRLMPPRGWGGGQSAQPPPVATQWRELRVPQGPAPRCCPRKPGQHLRPAPEERPQPTQLRSLGSRWWGGVGRRGCKEHKASDSSLGDWPPPHPACGTQTRDRSLRPCCPGALVSQRSRAVPPLNQTPRASFSCGGGEGSGRWRVGTGSLMAERHRVPRAPRGPGAGEGQSPPGDSAGLGVWRRLPT